MARVRGLIFDLDGVLVDSLPSITGCFNYALARSGLAEITTEVVRPLLGPPLEEAVAGLLRTEDAGEIARFVAVYRERYAEICTRETPGMPGLHAVLAALAERWPLAVATNKAEAFARPILAALGVAGFFVKDGICGRSLALGGGTKASVIARVAPLLGGAEGLIMIGDRSHDVVGARVHGIPTIGMLHGSGSREELVAAGARWIAEDLLALPSLVGRIDAGDEPWDRS